MSFGLSHLLLLAVTWRLEILGGRRVLVHRAEQPGEVLIGAAQRGSLLVATALLRGSLELRGGRPRRCGGGLSRLVGRRPAAAGSWLRQWSRR